MSWSAIQGSVFIVLAKIADYLAKLKKPETEGE